MSAVSVYVTVAILYFLQGHFITVGRHEILSMTSRFVSKISTYTTDVYI
jgi:hypothetical protein